MTWIGIGALACAIGIGAGAFGAHGLKTRLDPAALALWETAVRYLFVGAFGLVLIGLAQVQTPRTGLPRAAVALALGTAIFSGTVASLALGGPRWLGAVTPLGGLAMIAGFVLFALEAFQS